jgi:hypothetical protein
MPNLKNNAAAGLFPLPIVGRGFLLPLRGSSEPTFQGSAEATQNQQIREAAFFLGFLCFAITRKVCLGISRIQSNPTQLLGYSIEQSHKVYSTFPRSGVTRCHSVSI